MAGVAPFALVIAKHAQPARVDAVDLNEIAIRYALENVRLNKVEDKVFPVHADARAWSAAHEGVADRVITNLPHAAHAFAEDALRTLKPGGVWHYHCIQAEDGLGRHLAELAARGDERGRSLEVLQTRVVRAYSPRERHFAVDIRAG
jgi:tRNA G37 N-methylase Trm5